MSGAYYNEIDPFAAEWLRNLIAGGHIAPGEVDERSIEDVKPNDLRGFTQCHFFAGIGVWSYALRRAGWDDDRPVWTGSCPCQPFSAAGKGGGFNDERHLWPTFHWLISQCRPECVFGEQVASGNANAWFDLVQADVEAMDYAFGLVPFPSAGVGAPHIRDRAYWVAHTHNTGRWEGMPKCAAECVTGAGGVADRLANTDMQYESTTGDAKGASKSGGRGKVSELGNTQHNGYLTDEISESISELEEERQLLESQRPDTRDSVLQTSLPTNSFWRDADWLYCRDEKWRPVEPCTFPLVARFAKSLGHGKSSLRALAVRNRTGRLKGYGNALNAQAATAFIQAYLEVIYGPYPHN